jgi:hypothetical protein
MSRSVKISFRSPFSLACFTAGCIILIRFLVETFLYTRIIDISEEVDLFLVFFLHSTIGKSQKQIEEILFCSDEFVIIQA